MNSNTSSYGRTDPFRGGKLERLTPPNGGSSGIPHPGSSPFTPGTPMFARNNRGANVSIPYARVVPVAHPDAPSMPMASSYALTTTDKSLASIYYKEHGTHDEHKAIGPADGLSKNRLAWVLARRSTMTGSEFDVHLGGEDNVTIEGRADSHWDVGKGVNRATRLGSTEYVARTYEVATRRVFIQLAIPYHHETRGDFKSGDIVKYQKYKHGLLGYVARPAKQVGTSRTKPVPKLAYITDGLNEAPFSGVAGMDRCPNFIKTRLNDSHLAYWAAFGLRVDNYDTVMRFFTEVRAVLMNQDWDTTDGALDTAACVGAVNALGNGRKRLVQIPLDRDASMAMTNNVTFDIASSDMSPRASALDFARLAKRRPDHDSAAVRSVDNRAALLTQTNQEPDRNFKCGIYTTPLSPFLHGRTLLKTASATALPDEKHFPNRMADALGDHVAFAALEHTMSQLGLLDWRPDGVVNSKLENGPDKEADKEYDRRDGELYNVHVQGPAVCSNWCGSRGLVAGDHLFVAIVADLWRGCGNNDGDPTTQFDKLPYVTRELLKSGTPDANLVGAAREEREKILSAPMSAYDFRELKELGTKDLQRDYTRGPNRRPLPSLLTNFRVRYLTSSEMALTSAILCGADGSVVREKGTGKSGAWPTASRLGLAVSRCFGSTSRASTDDSDVSWICPDQTLAHCVAANAAHGGGGVADNRPGGKSEAEVINDYRTTKNVVAGTRKTIAETALGGLVKPAAKRSTDELDCIRWASTVGDDDRTALSGAHALGYGKTLLTATLINAAAGELGVGLHEVVVGAWHVGTVLDTAATRAAGRNFSSTNRDSACNVNVNIEWWSGDRLHKNYARTRGTGKDFRVRDEPAIGGIVRDGAVALEPLAGGGLNGISIVDYNQARDRYANYMHNDPGAPRMMPGDGSDQVATEAEAKVEFDALMKRRSTFPDPWDLPSATAKIRKIDKSGGNYDRDDYMGVALSRGVWDKTAPMQIQTGRTWNTTDFIQIQGSADNPAPHSGYKAGRGRFAIVDPGSNLMYKAGGDEDATVAFNPRKVLALGY